MTITAKIILDSMSPLGARLTTMQLCYPRFIHAEFMTHRVFSRNASSSRAIPVAKMIDMVRTNPAMPIHWGKNQPGMQANEELAETEKNLVQYRWQMAAEAAANHAEVMMEHGAHKQIANRILEPFQHIHVVVTATEWDNFFKLRLHPDAQPEIHELAKQMKAAMDASVPVQRAYHTPYVQPEEEFTTIYERMMVSAARCARVSYLNHDGSAPDRQKDFELAVKLKEAGHASPFEHPAIPEEFYPSMNANFRSWRSLRFDRGI